jgi:hypothetical protein
MGEHTWPIIRDSIEKVFTVEEDDIIHGWWTETKGKLSRGAHARPPTKRTVVF